MIFILLFGVVPLVYPVCLFDWLLLSVVGLVVAWCCWLGCWLLLLFGLLLGAVAWCCWSGGFMLWVAAVA